MLTWIIGDGFFRDFAILRVLFVGVLWHLHKWVVGKDDVTAAVCGMCKDYEGDMGGGSCTLGNERGGHVSGAERGGRNFDSFGTCV